VVLIDLWKEEEEETESWWSSFLKPVPLVELR